MSSSHRTIRIPLFLFGGSGQVRNNYGLLEVKSTSLAFSTGLGSRLETGTLSSDQILKAGALDFFVAVYCDHGLYWEDRAEIFPIWAGVNQPTISTAALVNLEYRTDQPKTIQIKAGHEPIELEWVVGANNSSASSGQARYASQE